jgi:HK97 family phage major capsid protein
MLFSISAFLSSAYAGVINPIREVITERGTNCYTAVLHHTGKMDGNVESLLSLVSRKAEALILGFNFDLTALGLAAMSGIALFSGFDLVEVGVAMATIPPVYMKSGKFKALNENEIKEHLPEVHQLAAYTIAENKHGRDQLEAKMEKLVGQDAIDALQAKFGELKEEHYKHLENAVDVQGKALAKLESQNDKLTILKETPQGFMGELKSIWAEHTDRISDYAKKSDHSTISFEMKTQVARAAVVNNTMAQDVPGVGQIPRRSTAISDLFNTGEVGSDSNGVIRYWDVASFTSAAAAVAEGGTIAESAIAWEELTCSVEKIGDSIPVTREMLNDVSFVEAEVRNFLLKNVELELDRQTLLGTGSSNQLKGITTIAPNWAAGDFADEVDEANTFDVLSTAIVQIANAGKNGMFVPNAIIMNPTDVEIMRLTKSSDGNYVMPHWMTDNGASVRGIRIIENQLVPVDEAYIGDFTFGTLWNSEGTMLDVATQHDTDWLKDVTRIKATMRKALLIRNAHAAAFLHIDGIAAAAALLETP